MKREKIILAIVAIATLLITIVGATFAWFSVRSNGSVNANTNIDTANLGTVTFTNGNSATVVGSEVYPGWSNDAITFSVIGANTTEPIEYTITASVTGSTTLGSALTYSMSCTSTNSGTCASTVNSAPLATTTYTGTLATGSDTHTYTVNMSLPETNTSQNDYQGLTYKVEFSVVLTNPATKYTASGSGRTTLPTASPEECFEYTINGNSVTIDGYQLSSTCTADVVIPSTIEGKTVDTIGSYAFRGSNGALGFNNSNSDEKYDVVRLSLSYDTDIDSVIIPNTVVTIGEHAFIGNNLTSVIIPDSVTSIGVFSFGRNYNLASVTLSNNLTEISDYAFQSTAITSITIPDSVISIGSHAFGDNSELTSVTFSNAGNLTTIGSGAFEYSPLQSNIIIPNGVTTIDLEAFNMCDNITNVTLPNTITSLGSRAFRSNNLQRVCAHGSRESVITYGGDWGSPFEFADGYSEEHDVIWNCTD